MPIVMFLLSAVLSIITSRVTEAIPFTRWRISARLFATDAASPADVDERLMAARVRLNRRLHCG